MKRLQVRRTAYTLIWKIDLMLIGRIPRLSFWLIMRPLLLIRSSYPIGINRPVQSFKRYLALLFVACQATDQTTSTRHGPASLIVTSLRPVTQLLP